MMDFRKLDRVRRGSEPLQLDLVEAFAQGKLSRREFVRRGTVLGLSFGTIAAVVAACGGSNNGGSSSSGGGDSSAAGPTSSAQVGVAENTNTGSTAAPAKTGGSIRVASIAPASPLDPVAMVDLASYAVIAQCFEYLCYAAPDLKLKPGLAESWEPNADGSEWTFKLRQGVKWQDGGDFTADDVVATMERLVKAGNSGLKGVLEAGGTTAADPGTVVFKLTGPNGNFPYLVGTDNPQTPITPKGYEAGTTLDKVPNGTGPFKLAKYDQKTGASFVRNDGWWGGKTPLDGSEWTFFQDLQPQVVALQQGQVDLIVQFSVLGGEGLLNDSNLNVIALRGATHREIWMRCDKGTFKDKRVRQAVAYTFDRQAMVQTLFKGTADIGNDHVIAPAYPFFDSSVPQRPKDIDKAKALLQEAGVTSVKATLHANKLQEIPDLAALVKQGAAEAGITFDISVEDAGPFYGKSWCPEKPADPPCSGAADIGIVDYGHRGVPDVYLNAALSTGGVWNSSQYANPDFDAAIKTYQAAVGIDAQKAACKTIETILLEDTPVGIPYFYNFLSAHSKKFTGIGITGLGQLNLSAASQA